VVGNPANTNAYIAMKSAPDLPKKNFTAMLRLDHNRALSQIASAGWQGGRLTSRSWWCGATTRPTMYPDYRFATVDGAVGQEPDRRRCLESRNVFLPTVGKRGAAIIEARGLSSAASAANAAIDHIRDWVLGTNGKWATMGIPSDGSYGIPEGRHVWVPGDLQGRQIRDGAGPRHRRLQPRHDGQDPGRAGRRARRRCSPAVSAAGMPRKRSERRAPCPAFFVQTPAAGTPLARPSGRDMIAGLRAAQAHTGNHA
jgi:hypothetical protein